MKVTKRNFWLVSLIAIIYSTLLSTATLAETKKPISISDSERFNSNIKAHTIIANKNISPELIPQSAKMLTALYSAKNLYDQFEVDDRLLLDSFDVLSPEGSKRYYQATSTRARTTLKKALF